MESVNYTALAFWLVAIGLPMLLLRRHLFIILAPPAIVLIVYVLLHTITPGARP